LSHEHLFVLKATVIHHFIRQLRQEIARLSFSLIVRFPCLAIDVCVVMVALCMAHLALQAVVLEGIKRLIHLFIGIVQFRMQWIRMSHLTELVSRWDMRPRLVRWIRVVAARFFYVHGALDAFN
jgi:hypothetical protein